tara:strand:- start:2413 stop:3624 length:1212 start_codon:yes stop_codon:yes gene_type:complete
MGLLKQSQSQYYSGTKSFTGDSVSTLFVVSTNTNQFPVSFSGVGVLQEHVKVYIDGALFAQESQVGTLAFTPGTFNYDFIYDGVNGWHIEFATAPAIVSIKVVIDTSLWEDPAGLVKKIVSYQFTTLKDVISNFVVAYTGEDKIIMKANRTDIQFHAMRALQELSFDTFKSTKSQEIEIPPSLKMILPQDYVNYVKFSVKDSSGTERVLYPAIKSSDPFAIKQKTNGDYDFDIDNDTAFDLDDTVNLISPDNSDTWNSYKSATSNESNHHTHNHDHDHNDQNNKRYGLDPQNAQVNGSFYINDAEGYVHFGSSLAGSTVTLKYISDSLGTDDEMVVHKFAEEALYKHIMYGILSTRMNIPEHVVQRFKKERFAETRKAKLRLSNIKIEEITQILRGKSKFIKH